MDISVIIDFKYLESINKTPNDLIALCYVSEGKSGLLKIDDLKELEDKNLIKIGKSSTVIRKEGRDLLDKFTTESIEGEDTKSDAQKIRSTKSIEEEVGDRIVEYRNIWRGLAPGAMGDPKACRDKLIRWMKENPEYGFEDILKAAEAYIDSLESYRYLQRADYFIYKQERNKTEVSRLSSFIGEEGGSSGDWTSNLV